LAVLTGFADGLVSDVEPFGVFSRSGFALDLGRDLPGLGAGPSTLGVTPPASSASCVTGSAWLSTRSSCECASNDIIRHQRCLGLDSRIVTIVTPSQTSEQRGKLP
jgi:hypothetical protein